MYKAKTLFRENDLQIQKMNEQGISTKEREEQRERLYRNCEDERSADKYALSHLKDKVNDAFLYINEQRMD